MLSLSAGNKLDMFYDWKSSFWNLHFVFGWTIEPDLLGLAWIYFLLQISCRSLFGKRGTGREQWCGWCIGESLYYWSNMYWLCQWTVGVSTQGSGCNVIHSNQWGIFYSLFITYSNNTAYCARSCSFCTNTSHPSFPIRRSLIFPAYRMIRSVLFNRSLRSMWIERMHSLRWLNWLYILMYSSI